MLLVFIVAMKHINDIDENDINGHAKIRPKEGYATKIKALAQERVVCSKGSVGQLLESCFGLFLRVPWKNLEKKPTPRKINESNLKMDGLVQMIFLKTRGPVFSGEPC